MIDIHSHLLYGLDDGAAKIEDSIRMLSEAEKVGIRYIISTTHCHDDLYKLDKVMQVYNKLVNRALDFGIVLKAGYEVFISDGLEEEKNKKIDLTLNNTKYILIEFPYSEFPPYGFNVLYNLYKKGMVPVISHPERCRFFIENINVLLNFVESGFLLQLDAASILGVYGRHAKATAKELLKLRKAHFVASNAHFADDYSEWYLKAYRKVRNYVGEEYTKELYEKNAREIVKAKEFKVSYFENA